ncbi:MAG: 2'-deoxycytidine 5'-triphosphate deaminase, partial [Planctomycetota bacterium]|nr:2'-deoxycytidine 5'-triphosphate deaminase [Planctomycetota bacterium]
MILSDKTITEMLDSGQLVVEPLAENSIQPASIDCRLGDHFLLVDENRMDCLSMNSEIRYRSLECEDITLPPHSFLLATTLDYV